MLKSMIIAAFATLSIQAATAQTQQPTQQPRKITGQDSGAWHQPRVPRRDTPPRTVTPYRQNTMTPVPTRPNTPTPKPGGVNPDSMRVRGSQAPSAPIQGNPADPMRR